MGTPLVIWGASGQARVLAEFVGGLGYELVALFENDRRMGSPFPGVPIHHDREGFVAWRARFEGPEVAGLVAIGSSGAARLALHDLMASHGVPCVTVVHPTAWVARNAYLGAGCQILAQSAVAAEATLGRQCILNTAASVDHECQVGDGVHIAPGARLTGCIRVGDRTFIGAGTVVLPRLRIGSDVVIGAGSVVTRDIPDGVVAYGSPARVVRPNRP